MELRSVDVDCIESLGIELESHIIVYPFEALCVKFKDERGTGHLISTPPFATLTSALLLWG